MIIAKNVTKTYFSKKGSIVALKNINLEIDTGEFVAVAGPSICGKSTLLNVLGLLITPDSGKVFFSGTDTTLLNKKKLMGFRNKHIGFMRNGDGLDYGSSVFDNLEYPLIQLKIGAEERIKRVKQLLDQITISNSQRLPGQLSGGEQQKLAIAKAAVGNPDLILADEPTDTLETKDQKLIMDLLYQLNDRGTTIIISTHLQDQADYCHRIIHMREGELLPH